MKNTSFRIAGFFLAFVSLLSMFVFRSIPAEADSMDLDPNGDDYHTPYDGVNKGVSWAPGGLPNIYQYVIDGLDSTYLFSSDSDWSGTQDGSAASQARFFLNDIPVGQVASINSIRAYMRIKRGVVDSTIEDSARVFIRTPNELYTPFGYHFGDWVEIPDLIWHDYYKEWTQNPETSAPWTVNDLNSLRLGIDMKRAGTWGGNPAYTFCSELWLVVDYVQNNPPSITSPANQTIYEDTSTGPLDFVIGDFETPAADLVVSGSSDNTTLAQDANIQFGGIENYRTVTVTPEANQTGTATITLTVTDGAGASTSDTFLLTVNGVNDAPSGTDNTVTTAKNTDYIFSAADFGFSDPNDSPPNNFQAVKITTLPVSGSLLNNGGSVSAGAFIAKTDIDAGKLVFRPAPNASGSPYASFTFQVQDDGGTANGGVDLDPSPNTMTIDVVFVNHAPQGTDKTVTTKEDTDYVFAAADFGFSDPNDSPPNDLMNVKINTLPGAGSLLDNGVPVSAGAFIFITDIENGWLVFRPAANANGSPYTSFAFQVQDDGGTDNGGADLDPSPNTLTINVTSVNDAPSGTNKTVTTLEDTNYTFTAADFGFSDPNDTPSNNFLSVKITTLPGAGSLTDNGSVVSEGEFVTVADINAAMLIFSPIPGASGIPYASFTFQVRDDGGTDNGGVDLDPSPKTLTINVTSVNDAPQGTDKTVTTKEDTDYVFAAADFGFSDPNDSPSNSFQAVKITTLPGAGSVLNNGVSVSAEAFISITDINAGRLVFRPSPNASGSPYASFTFQVQDNGGTANGGADLDPSPKTMTVNVTPLNDAPSGTNKTVTTLEDTNYTFTAADFGFSDPNDTPPNNFLSVKITTLPGAGSLTDNGAAVSPGAFVTVADIDAARLVFSPAPNANGTPYTSFTFQVRDDGVTANGGADLDPSPNTMTINVTPVNDQPSFIAGGNQSVLEDAGPQTVPGWATSISKGPPNESGQTLQFIVNNDNPALFSAQPAISAGGTLTYTPTPATSGAASLTVILKDSGGTANGGVDTSSPQTFTITVIPHNDVIPGPPPENSIIGAPCTITVCFNHDGVPRSGVLINFLVTSGPNSGTGGSCNTNGAGQAWFTYCGGSGVGTDTILATAVGPGGVVLDSAEITKQWDPHITGVGGEVQPVDRAGLTMPWIAAALLLIVVSWIGIKAVRRRAG